MNRRMMEEKENIIPKQVYDQLLQNQVDLNNYLKFIRFKKSSPKVIINTNFLKQNSIYHRDIAQVKEKKNVNQIKKYIQSYVKMVREVNGMESYVGKKIIRKILQYLEEFPTMSYLVENVNTFGKQKKKICLSQGFISQYATDEMIPLFQKIIEKIQNLKKEAESKKLMELGHRIEYLQTMITKSKDKIDPLESQKIFKTFESDRIEKYIVMEENLGKAEKNYGKFSEIFQKNKEVFTNINKVYTQIHQAIKLQ